MRTAVLVLAVCLVTAGAAPQKIIGGSLTTIEEYPYAVALLYSYFAISFTQACGGTILNNRSILSAGHCFHRRTFPQWRTRVGSTLASSGGTVLTTSILIIHPDYSASTTDNDVGILRTTTAIPIGTATVAAGSIAGNSYNLGNNVEVWAIGWGTTSQGGSRSEQLRHVQLWTVNQETCRQRYHSIARDVTDGMLCSGWLDVGGRDQCQGDSGGPLLHNHVVVGVCSWGNGCAQPYFPGVNARVSVYTDWIVANA